MRSQGQDITGVRTIHAQCEPWCLGKLSLHFCRKHGLNMGFARARRSHFWFPRLPECECGRNGTFPPELARSHRTSVSHEGLSGNRT